MADDASPIERLRAVMARLRSPDGGCPWDIEQTFATIAPYTIEEAYEVADAIARGDLDDLRDELGDLLLQVVYHAQMAEEAGEFAFGDVVEAITTKMIRRHPHVFADQDGNIAPAGVKSAWERIKAEEKAERAARSAFSSALMRSQTSLTWEEARLPSLSAKTCGWRRIILVVMAWTTSGKANSPASSAICA